MATNNPTEKVSNEMKQKAQKAKDKMEEKGNEMSSKLEKTMEDWKDNADSYLQTMRKSIKDNPIQSLAIVSLVAFVAGTFCGKKN